MAKHTTGEVLSLQSQIARLEADQDALLRVLGLGETFACEWDMAKAADDGDPALRCASRRVSVVKAYGAYRLALHALPPRLRERVEKGL